MTPKMKVERARLSERSSAAIKTESNSNKFLNKLEALSGVEMPVYIKNILHLNRFDNYLAFCSLNSEMLSELEIFVKEDMLDLIEEDCNLENYFGIYYKNPQKFRFLIGDKALLMKLVDLVNNKQDIDYWNSSPPVKKEENKNYPKIQLSHTDINIEENKFAQMIKNSLQSLAQKNRGIELFQSFAKISTDELDFQVTVKELNGNDDTSDSSSYNAKVKCVLCSTVISIAKQMRGWIISNYIRHLQTHVLSADGKRQFKRKRASKNSLNNTLYDGDDDDDDYEDDDDSILFDEKGEFYENPMQDSIHTKTTSTFSNNKKTKNNSKNIKNVKLSMSPISWPPRQLKC